MAIDLRYPIGTFAPERTVSGGRRRHLVESLAEVPGKLRAAAGGLSGEQLNTLYRPGGWTVQQVVHHLADSHMNSYIRMKLAATEPEPTVKPYDEKAWAELGDARAAPPEPSLALLEALHERWVTFLRSLTAVDFGRTFRHPEAGVMSLDAALQYYEWHGRHHVAHITALRQRLGW